MPSARVSNAVKYEASISKCWHFLMYTMFLLSYVKWTFHAVFAVICLQPPQHHHRHCHFSLSPHTYHETISCVSYTASCLRSSLLHTYPHRMARFRVLCRGSPFCCTSLLSFGFVSPSCLHCGTCNRFRSRYAVINVICVRCIQLRRRERRVKGVIQE